MRRLLGCWMTFLFLAAACTGGGQPPPPPCSRETSLADACPAPSPVPTVTTNPPFDPNATLNVQMLGDVSDTFDPQEAYYQVNWELYRCCLLRTLMSYRGTTTDEGGTMVVPDLAARPPRSSADGLTWTFQIRPGIHYSPPLQNVAVTAGDFVRAIDREACVTCTEHGYPNYYTVIRGFSESRSSTRFLPVAGIRAVDPLTLQVKLTQPAGDLPFRFAMPATAPIPPLPGHPAAPFGIATGHDRNDGRFALVGTGPYMIEGTTDLNFSLPPSKQRPVSGYTPNKGFVFVRNPSWDKSTDTLRQQNVRQMDFTIGGTEENAAREVDTGKVDICMDCPPITDQVARYVSNGDPTHRVQIHAADALRYISMNVAEPPFNDIHVRKAVEFAIDKQKLRRLRAGDLLGGGLGGTIAHHIFPDSLEGNLLFHYNPYATPNDNADLFKAKHEMSRSKYDQDHDGVCDKPACKNVLTIIDENPPYPDQANLIAHDLKPLGITLTVAECNRCTFMFPTCPDPTTHAALCPTLAWGKDYPDGFTFGGPLFSGKAILCPGPVFVSNACLNTTLVGAGPALLERYGYTTTQVPSVDPQIKRCERLVGDTRISCWAYLDKYLMEKVVPIVPLQFDNTVNVLARRVHCYSYDQFAGEVALDHLCVRS